jgi:hypothetical protein
MRAAMLALTALLAAAGAAQANAPHDGTGSTVSHAACGEAGQKACPKGGRVVETTHFQYGVAPPHDAATG